MYYKMEKEESLLQSRRVLKSTVTELNNYVAIYDKTAPENKNVNEICVRKFKLDELWDKYDKVQTELERLNLDTHVNDRWIWI